jgi:acyl-homoserine lactone acylase PvdQ
VNSRRRVRPRARRGVDDALEDAGQSGQPGSRFWGDQAPLWNAGDYKPMRFSKDRLDKIDGLLVFRAG